MTNAERLRAMVYGAQITSEDLLQAANELEELAKERDELKARIADILEEGRERDTLE